MKPFSDNVIFYDTEFTSLNPYVGDYIGAKTSFVGRVLKLAEEEFGWNE